MEPPVTAAQRLPSLDVFRGFVVAAAILVLRPGGPPDAIPGPLKRATWGELPMLADLVLPWFVLIMGVAMAFWIPPALSRAGKHVPRRSAWGWRIAAAFAGVVLFVPAIREALGPVGTMLLFVAFGSLLQQAAFDLPRGPFWCQVLRRTWILLILGWITTASVTKRLSLGLDVLQLLGLVSLAATLCYVRVWAQRFWIVAALLLAHWALLRFVPHPLSNAAAGGGTVVLENDRHILRWIDEHWLGPHFAGLWALLPATALALIGTLAGDLVRSGELCSGEQKQHLLATGALIAVVGWLWHWDQRFDAGLWTAPWVLCAGGAGLLVFAGWHALLLSIPAAARWTAPLAVLGRHPLAAWCAAILLPLHTIDEWQVAIAPGTVRSVTAVVQGWITERLGATAGSLLWSALWIAAVCLLCWRFDLWLAARRARSIPPVPVAPQAASSCAQSPAAFQV